MKFVKTLTAGLLAAASFGAMAADYSDGDIHKGDYKWYQFNLMYTTDQYPMIYADEADYNDTYMEMEFGGRSGLWELYGYVDVFDVTDSSASNNHESTPNNAFISDNGGLFMKFNPRLSLDALTGKDLSMGPIDELFISSLNHFGDGQAEHLIGLGANVNVPWLGKTGMNLYARYSAKNWGNPNEGKFNGYQFSMNWFKPFYFFENKSFISYQGYWDHLFGANDYDDQYGRTSSGGATFHGIYWHSDRYSVGYGLKYFYDVYGWEDGTPGFEEGTEVFSTGFGHYFAVTYKF